MRAHCHTESTQAIYHDADIRKLRSDARTDIKTRKIEKNYKRICTNCANKANIQRPSKTAEKRPNATSARYLKESIECLEKKKKKTKRHSTPKTTIARNMHPHVNKRHVFTSNVKSHYRDLQCRKQNKKLAKIFDIHFGNHHQWQRERKRDKYLKGNDRQSGIGEREGVG